MAAASTAYAALLVFAQGRPSLDVDSGVLLSVAARLLQGDHLYRDVWDNKDPLFFYFDAAALWVAGWRGPFLLDVLWVATAASAVWLLLRALGVPLVACVTGFLAYPLLLTGEWLDGDQAAGAGLVWRCVPDEELLATTLEVAGQIARHPLEAVVATKQLLLAAKLDSVRSAFAREIAVYDVLLGGPANQAAIEGLLSRAR